MKKSSQLLQEGRKDVLWEKYCGYLKLKRSEFMEIQKRLLLEQLNLVGSSKLGQELLGDNIPKSVDEFRESVPLTTYSDYEDYLDKQVEEVLPVKPIGWARTSGRSAGRGPKWVPITKPMYDRLADAVIGSMIMSSCSGPGDVKLQLQDKVLLSTAPPPYISGYLTQSTNDQLDLRFLPSLEEGEKMEFGERIAVGFRMAMKEGLDYFYGIASVLSRIGEQFSEGSNKTKPSPELLNPTVLWRLIRALLVSKFQNRGLLPKDVWKLKGIMVGGTDTDIYKERIEHYWGRKPLEGYACTEGGTMCMQAWNYKGMVFFPDCDFLEFIPNSEYMISKENPDYQPKTVLFDELGLGVYELVFTNFYGGIFTRYRVGDMFEVVSLGDKELGSELPQVQFYSRADDIIDIAGFARLTEKTIWKTIEKADISYQDWVARKEFVQEKAVLHIYIEPKGKISLNGAKDQIKKYLSEANSDFKDIETMLGYDPLKLSTLPEGAFAAFMQAQQEAGADLAHVKPPHMQPSDAIMMRLESDNT